VADGWDDDVNQGMRGLVMIMEFLFLCISYLSLLYF